MIAIEYTPSSSLSGCIEVKTGYEQLLKPSFPNCHAINAVNIQENTTFGHVNYVCTGRTCIFQMLFQHSEVWMWAQEHLMPPLLCLLCASINLSSSCFHNSVGVD